MSAGSGGTGECPQSPTRLLCPNTSATSVDPSGGNALSPKEFYELDLSRLAPFSVDQGLNTAACLRHLFRAIFLADAFSELQAPPLMGTIVMVQGHRDCGEDWFRPKLNYRVPSRGHKLTVTLSCGRPSVPAMASEDYIWFQAPVTLKGFHE